ncbi:MAG TPA: polysaccharide biosynthesis protein [Firmicutes bacterium]|nr:polysaccharide biosynthesis protein [Bacillota bacterium]
MEKRDSIIKGTALLTGAGLVVKLLGAAYRIPLSRLIGPEGIGLYQMAYPVYLIFLSLSTAGLPIAISKIIAEYSAEGNQNGIRKIFRAALILLMILGLTGTATMIWAAPWFACKVVADPRAVYSMWALAPAIFLMSLMAAYRGYFQGQQMMAPSAVSQMIEQTVRVGVALILVAVFIKNGLEWGAAGAAFGASAGGAAGLVYLIYTYWRQSQPQKGIRLGSVKSDSFLKIMRRLIQFALPISLAVILMPLLQTIDSLIVPAKLQSIGYTVPQATSLLGILGNSWAVMYLPMIVTTAISTNLVPAIAAGNIKGFLKRGFSSGPRVKIEAGLRMAVFYLIPVAIFLYLFSSSIYRIIYGTPQVEILSWLAPAVIFLGLEQVSAGILQGLGKPKLPLVHFIAGAILKIAVTFFTTGLPGLNLAGAALGTVCGSGLTALLNITIIRRLIRIKLRFLPAAVLSGILLFIAGWYGKCWLQLNYIVEFGIIGLGGSLLYIGSLWFTGGIVSQDLEMVKKYLAKRSVEHGYGNITPNR